MALITFLLIGLHCISSTTRSEGMLYPPPVVYPYGGTIKLVAGIALPIKLTGKRILTFAHNLQFQYALPQNASIFTDYYSSLKRRKRSVNTANQRLIFYQYLEQQFSRWCGGDGMACMMRSICQLSQTPVGDESLVGEILNVILTPDYGNSSFSSGGRNYLGAAEAGRRGDNCQALYTGCTEGCGFLERISEYYADDID